MEANAEHDFRLKRLIGMLRTMERAQYFFVPSAKRHCQEDLLTPESYMLKKKLHKSGSKSYFYAIIVLLVYASICKPMRKHKTYLFLL